jgi:SAM-dependent methyltransferase
MAVPGCGRGHDALLFAAAGHHVHGIDVAPTAVADATAMAHRAGVTDRATFEVGDVLDFGRQHPHAFDYVLERACFCALDPSVREEYVASIATALRPNGLLIGSFFVGIPTGGPPFAAPWDVIMASLVPWFDIEEHDEARAEGLMAGSDLFAILRKRV